MSFRSILSNLVFLTSICLLISMPFFSGNLSERETYDIFLQEQYKQAPNNSSSGEKADQPDMAAFQNYFMTIDPALKRVPSERLLESYRSARELRKQASLKSASFNNNWTQVSSNMGGRTRAIAWDPNDLSGKKAWAGGVTGGLWHNNDITMTNSQWEIVNDFWPSLSISSIVFDPNDPQIIYVGTGEYQTARFIYRESSGVGMGIWKSTDAGETWDILPSTEDFKYISDIKIRNENGTSAIYAGVVSGFYHGINQTSQPTDGLYRSVDGGQNWEQVLPDIAGETVPYAPADLEVGPGGRIFVGTIKNLNGDGGATILYSDDGTAGSWTVYDDYEAIIQNDPNYPIPGRVIIACAPSDENVVYALVGAGWFDSMNANRAEGRYILRSNDGGENWSQKSLPDGDPGWASLSWHAFAGAVSPANPDDFFVGGLDVWKTLNAGSSWSHLSDWAGMYYGGGDDYVHADQHVQIYKPGSSAEMLLSTDGGVFYTNNANSSSPIFQEKNNNYSTLQFYTCDIYPVSGINYFIGGLQDNGTLLYQGDPLDINDMIDGADGAYCFFDENEPNVMITSYYYNAYTFFLNWDDYTSTWGSNSGVFINPADYDSQNNILFANAVTFEGYNANKLIRYTNVPYNSNGQMFNLNTGLNTYFSVVKMSHYAPEGSSTLFAGSQNGRLFKVTGAQSTPDVTEIGSSDFPVAYLSSIAIGSSEDTLMVTFSNYGVQSVWQTYNGGDNWTDISGNLPDMPIRWAIYHPQSAKQAMLATELGVWETLDASAPEVSWVQDEGMPNVRVDMLQMRTSDNTLLAATHGRGLMYCTWAYNPVNSVKENNVAGIELYPNPANDLINFNLQQGTNAVARIFTLDGKVMIEKAISASGQLDVKNLENGTYITEIWMDDQVKSEKLIIRR